MLCCKKNKVYTNLFIQANAKLIVVCVQSYLVALPLQWKMRITSFEKVLSENPTAFTIVPAMGHFPILKCWQTATFIVCLLTYLQNVYIKVIKMTIKVIKMTL